MINHRGCEFATSNNKEIPVSKKERIGKVLSKIRQIAPDSLKSDNTVSNQSPAVKVINSVLSLGMNYKTVVKPRLDAFQDKNPDVIQVSDLANLIASYPTPYNFLKAELNFCRELKATAIDGVVKQLSDITNASPSVSEEDAIRQWALQAEILGYRVWSIKGFRLAGFQWLRMLFGADTVKPDRHIVNFLSDTLNEKVSPLESVELIEASSADSEYSARDLDRIIWKFMSEKSSKLNV